MDPLYGFAIAHDMIVAAGPDGILVAGKEQSSYIKKYVENMDIRPMYEEREWGDYTVLNISVDETRNKAVTKKENRKEKQRDKRKSPHHQPHCMNSPQR